jgi:thiosulfate/3-mercaptopyruvate sulfurtransferase
MKPDAGEAAYLEGLVPGALYAHLDRDLSGAKTGRNGRHPLPSIQGMAARAGAWGITPETQVVTYDGQGGAQAARAWWLLRWIGHEAVAVLDGGLAAWRAAGGGLKSGAPAAGALRAASPYPARAGSMKTVDAEGAARAASAGLLTDARALERFRGEVEPLDPVAGHIPGARHRFFKDNLQGDGLFKPAAVLCEEFARLDLLASAMVHSCGSGVTACHNLLAMAHAGLGETTLYPGSWSEWCSDPKRPVARG